MNSTPHSPPTHVYKSCRHSLCLIVQQLESLHMDAATFESILKTHLVPEMNLKINCVFCFFFIVDAYSILCHHVDKVLWQTYDDPFKWIMKTWLVPIELLKNQVCFCDLRIDNNSVSSCSQWITWISYSMFYGSKNGKWRDYIYVDLST